MSTNGSSIYGLQQMQKTDVCLETSSSCTWMQKWRNERRLDADICLFIDKDISLHQCHESFAKVKLIQVLDRKRMINACSDVPYTNYFQQCDISIFFAIHLPFIHTLSYYLFLFISLFISLSLSSISL